MDSADHVENLCTEDGPSGKRRNRNDSGATSPTTQTPTKKTRSEVWDHFTRIPDNNDKCKCHYCGRFFSCQTKSGTSNLKKHLLSCKQYMSWKCSKGLQQAITPDGHLKLAKVSEETFREATNELVVLSELPLTFVDSLGWRNFCNKVNLYDPHSRRTATRDIVQIYVRKKDIFRDFFRKTKQRVSLTTDIWTAPTTNSSYMVVTAHFIDSCWRLKKLIIAFKHISNHKGPAICSVLLQCLTDWGIDKVFTITVDNATANTSALRLFKERFTGLGVDSLVLGGEFLHMRCAAHIINLIVKDGLHAVDKSVMAVRNAVQYVRSSTQRLESFESKVQVGKSVSRGSLPLDCKTRWNSTFLMLSRASKFRDAFDRMEVEDKLYNDYFLEEDKDGNQRIGPPNDSDWQAIDKLVQFLVIFYQSTLTVSASTTVNSHKCYLEICAIEQNLIRLSECGDEDLKGKAISMRLKFDKYWAGLREVNRLLIIACVLDPRCKMEFPQVCFDMLYGKDSEIAKGVQDSVLEVLRRLFEEYNLIYSTLDERSTASTSVGSTSRTSHSFGLDCITADDFEFAEAEGLGYQSIDRVYQSMVSQKGLYDASSELEIYLSEPTEKSKSLNGMEFDILGWWRLNGHKYPILSEIARDVLAMQVSSVASESAFSTSGRILDPYRSCLTHNTLEVLMCTQQWLKQDIAMNERGAATNAQLLADIELQDNLQKEYGL